MKQACRFAAALRSGVLLIISLSAVAGAQTESIIHSFSGSVEGGQPLSSVIADAAGNLYGTTSQEGPAGAGTVYKLARNGSSWTLTVLWTFSGGKDGGQPGGLVLDAKGNLYGATSAGGAHNLGVVYKLTPTTSGLWKQHTLYAFAGAKDGGTPPDTWYPSALVFDASGNLYGTTLYGVAHPLGGAVFKLSPNSNGTWSESVIYDFSGGNDGQFPACRNLVFDASGNLYGTTNSGGTYGSGVIFKLTPVATGPWTQTILYSFNGQRDGGAPNGGLIFDKAGNLYGTTLSGGSRKCYPGCGVVFKLSPTASGPWVERQLFVFENREVPFGGLVADPNGNLYGTTSGGGTDGVGTVFKLTPGPTAHWTETVLHSFSTASGDGQFPHATLLRDAAGNLYGTAFLGGTSFAGVVFAVTP